MKIGVTGTREGWTVLQEKLFSEFLKEVTPAGEFHHGDCRGVDVQAAKVASDLGYFVVCHPPLSKTHRGFARFDAVRPEKGYLERDRAIVDEVDLLLVVPKQNKWHSTGGTWYTHDYAVKRKKPIVVFYPNGTTETNSDTK